MGLEGMLTAAGVLVIGEALVVPPGGSKSVGDCQGKTRLLIVALGTWPDAELHLQGHSRDSWVPP